MSFHYIILFLLIIIAMLITIFSYRDISYSAYFIFRRPLLSTMKNIFILPFQRDVWIAIAIFLLLVFCLLYLSMKWEHYRGFSAKSAKYWNQFHVDKPTAGDDILVLLGAVAQQGTEEISDSDSIFNNHSSPSTKFLARYSLGKYFYVILIK